MAEETEPSTLSYATPELEDGSHPIALYLLGLLGILASIVFFVPTPIGIKTRGRPNLSDCTIRSGGPLGMQIEIYRTHMKHYPASLADLTTRPFSDDASLWQGPYIKDNKSLMDPWGRTLRYRFPAERDKETYDLWSTGPDGIDHTDDDITNYPKE